MEKRAGDGMNACSALGAAYATGCAPEGATPTQFGAAPSLPKTSQRRNAHLEAVLKAITQCFSGTSSASR
jgi:hypothetical protein